MVQAPDRLPRRLDLPKSCKLHTTTVSRSNNKEYQKNCSQYETSTNWSRMTHEQTLSRSRGLLTQSWRKSFFFFQIRYMDTSTYLYRDFGTRFSPPYFHVVTLKYTKSKNRESLFIPCRSRIQRTKANDSWHWTWSESLLHYYGRWPIEAISRHGTYPNETKLPIDTVTEESLVPMPHHGTTQYLFSDQEQ